MSSKQDATTSIKVVSRDLDNFKILTRAGPLTVLIGPATEDFAAGFGLQFKSEIRVCGHGRKELRLENRFTPVLAFEPLNDVSWDVVAIDIHAETAFHGVGEQCSHLDDLAFTGRLWCGKS